MATEEADTPRTGFDPHFYVQALLECAGCGRELLLTIEGINNGYDAWELEALHRAEQLDWQLLTPPAGDALVCPRCLDGNYHSYGEDDGRTDDGNATEPV